MTQVIGSKLPGIIFPVRSILPKLTDQNAESEVVLAISDDELRLISTWMIFCIYLDKYR